MRSSLYSNTTRRVSLIRNTKKTWRHRLFHVTPNTTKLGKWISFLDTPCSSCCNTYQLSCDGSDDWRQLWATVGMNAEAEQLRSENKSCPDSAAAVEDPVVQSDTQSEEVNSRLAVTSQCISVMRKLSSMPGAMKTVLPLSCGREVDCYFYCSL